MRKPSTPKDEPNRMAMLRALAILDTPPEERFDQITRMAKRLFDVPISAVSLIDDNRQWFKSRVGLDASETHRDISFCGHAILGDEVFTIPNAIKDERFADNPLVTDAPHIRFYAGCPIKAPDGSKLGTLCIIDRKPRNFTKEDLAALIDLTTMVEREFSAILLATTDDLTNILNRRGFTQLARHNLVLCKREKIPASLVYFDLDDFKLINDTYGHAEGDRVLSIFADHLKRTCRNSDIVARLGGDEFVALLNHDSKQEAEILITRLQRSIDETNRKNAREYAIAFSHGIVEYRPRLHGSIDPLLEECDALMYQAKKNKTITHIRSATPKETVDTSNHVAPMHLQRAGKITK